MYSFTQWFFYILIHTVTLAPFIGMEVMLLLQQSATGLVALEIGLQTMTSKSY